MMKQCSKCLQEKPMEQFYLESHHKDGRRSDCKICHSEYCKINRKNYYNRHRNEILTKGKAPHIRIMARKKKRRDTKELRKYYITHLFRGLGLKKSEISDEFIQMKREQIQFHRLARGVKRRIKNGLHYKTGE